MEVIASTNKSIIIQVHYSGNLFVSNNHRMEENFKQVEENLNAEDYVTIDNLSEDTPYTIRLVCGEKQFSIVERTDDNASYADFLDAWNSKLIAELASKKAENEQLVKEINELKSLCTFANIN